MMASAQVVETSVNTNNSPSQDNTTNPDDHSNYNIYFFTRTPDLSVISTTLYRLSLQTIYIQTYDKLTFLNN